MLVLSAGGRETKPREWGPTSDHGIDAAKCRGHPAVFSQFFFLAGFVRAVASKTSGNCAAAAVTKYFDVFLASTNILVSETV